MSSYFSPENYQKSIKHPLYAGYELIVNTYETSTNSRSLTEGVVEKSGVEVARVQRNYHGFPYLFFHNYEGHVIFVCGGGLPRADRY